jgi:hypothetical protein
MFSKIIMTFPQKKMLIKQGLILQIFKGPFPAWLISVLGMGINFLLRKDKIMEQMKRHTIHRTRSNR